MSNIYGTVRLARVFSWYVWLVRYAWYAWCAWYGTVGTLGTAYRTKRTNRTVPSAPTVPNLPYLVFGQIWSTYLGPRLCVCVYVCVSACPEQKIVRPHEHYIVSKSPPFSVSPMVSTMRFSCCHFFYCHMTRKLYKHVGACFLNNF